MSVLVDTSVWVEHFRQARPALAGLLAQDRVTMHPMVLGELACGRPPNRASTLRDLARLQTVQQASLREVMDFVSRESLYGLGCGIVDLMLLASTILTKGCELWTLDKRLDALAQRFRVSHLSATRV